MKQGDIIVYMVIIVGAIAFSAFISNIIPAIIGFVIVIYLYNKSEQ